MTLVRTEISQLKETTMALTTTQRRACLHQLGLSQRGFAAMIEWDDSTVRRWMRDPTAVVPPEIDAWLMRRARAARAYNAAMEADPPPILPHKPGPKPAIEGN